MRKHALRRVLRLTEARTPVVRAIRAWRNLLPDWTPSLDALRELDTRPHEHVAVVSVISQDWEPGDPRWDCLMSLIEWERRDAVANHIARQEAEADRRVREWEESLLAYEAEPYAPPEENQWEWDGTEPERPAAVIPIRVVNSHGQTLSETTVQTKVKHLSEKSDG